MNQNNFEYKSDNKFEKTNMEAGYMSTNMDMGCCGPEIGNMCPPIQECPQERVCHRYICYEVPHVCQFM